MFTSPRARRLMAIAALLAVVLSTLALALTAVAHASAAHGDAGEMTITKAEATSPTTVRVEVGLVYANDAELATGATVNAVLTHPSGSQVGPVGLSRLDEDSSLYGGDVTVPQAGAWRVAVASTEPAGTATATVQVQETTTTTAAETTTTAEATSTTSATSTTAAGATSTTNAAGTEDDDGGSSNAGLIAALVGIGVVLGGGLAWYVASKRGSPKDTGSDDGLPPAAP